MERPRIRLFACILLCGIVTAGWAAAQDGGGQGPPQFSPDKLDQMVAPIALYPDSLLSQVLMAATYPLEVVECERWVEQNPGVKGDQLDQALSGKDWDPSVKSMASFPDVLKRLNDDLDWTQDLGTAFLNQQKDVMDAVQRMRLKAQGAGNLKTTTQQKVVVEQQVIQIEPADPQVIYVPAYDPTIVYGSGWYAPYWYYPAVMVPPPGWVYAANAMSFMAGVWVGAAMFGGFDWWHGNVYVNNNIFINKRYYNNNVVYNKNVNHNTWQHDNNHPMPTRPGQGGSGEYHGGTWPGKGGSGEYHGGTWPGKGGSGEYHGGTRPGEGGSGEYHGGTRPGEGGSGEYRGWENTGRIGQEQPVQRDLSGAGHQNAFSGYKNGSEAHLNSERGSFSRGGGAGGGMPHGGGGGGRRR